jgi:hypothetical protein
MKNKKRTIELANLVVLFGKAGLVSKFKTRFFPVVSEGRVKGRGEVSVYRFHNVQVDFVGKIPVMYGQLLKFMNIEAEQDYDHKTGALIDSSNKMPSVPSSFFLVDLTTHRLSYLGETRRAPTLRDFEYCVKKLLKADWSDRRRKLKKELLDSRGEQRLTKKNRDKIEESLEKHLPFVEVRVTPLPAIKKLGDTLSGFKIITHVSVKPMLRNNELSDENAEFLRSLEKQQDNLGSKNTSLSVSNPTQGLKKPEVKKMVKAASSGNYDVKVKGRDNADEDIDTNLRDVSVKFKEEVPARENVKNRARRLLEKMHHAFRRGYVLAVKADKKVVREAQDMVSELNAEKD